jgi:3'-5' exoribonuclease
MTDIRHSVAVPAIPDIFRVVEMTREQLAGGFRMTALLHHAVANPTVTWKCRQPDIRLKPGVLVKPRGMKSASAPGAAIPVDYLMVLERPEACLNLFDTVPPAWVRDDDLLVRASTLWGELPSSMRMLFNAVFWCGDRFRRYCDGPSSLHGHHAAANGNLRHSVEVAETVLRLLPLYMGANAGLAVLAALLHDAGKADEYGARGSGLRMSDQGRLLGHRTTVAGWLAVARDRMTLGIADAHYLSLLHSLTAVPGAPAWMGMREPATPEAMLLSMADRASGHADLMNHHMAPDGGWGRSHPHMKTQPFTTPPNGIVRPPFAGLAGLLKRVRAEQGKEAIAFARQEAETGNGKS